MGGTGPGAVDEARSWPRTMVIALPWLLAAGLAAAGVLGVGQSEGSPSAAPTTATPVVVPTGAASPTPVPDEAAESDGAPAPDAPGPSTPGAAPATAESDLPGSVQIAVLAAARATLGTAGLSTADGPMADSWALDLRIGPVQPVTDRFAIVTVTGLVIEHDGVRWSGPHARSVAVPLRTTDTGPLVTGQAWPLAPPVEATTEAEAMPLDDPDPALVAVLEDAGWTVGEVTAAGLVDGELLRVELSGAPPHHAGASGPHVVWMLDAPGGPHLLPLQPPHQQPDELQENP